MQIASFFLCNNIGNIMNLTFKNCADWLIELNFSCSKVYRLRHCSQMSSPELYNQGWSPFWKHTFLQFETNYIIDIFIAKFSPANNMQKLKI